MILPIPQKQFPLMEIVGVKREEPLSKGLEACEFYHSFLKSIGKKKGWREVERRGAAE